MPDRHDARPAGTDRDSDAEFKRQADGDEGAAADAPPERSTPADAIQPATRGTRRAKPGGNADDGSKNTVPNVR